MTLTSVHTKRDSRFTIYNSQPCNRRSSAAKFDMSLILIVEDNEKNLKLVRDVLQVKGYETVDAGTAENGLRLARERKPSLILMDIQLPGMSGVDALKALRAEPETAGIPVVAVTASVMQQDRQQIMRAGFDGFIEKPINLRKLFDTVQQALAGGKT